MAKQIKINKYEILNKCYSNKAEFIFKLKYYLIF